MEQIRAQAVQILNEAKLNTDPGAKVDSLKALQEVILHKEPSLLQEFLSELEVLQAEPHAAVRKFLVDFYEAAVAQSPTARVISSGLGTLSSLLSDSASAVVKQALKASGSIFRAAFHAALKQGKDPGYPQELLVMWQTARAACKRICDLVVDGSPNSLRVVAVKFLEQAIVLCTKELPPKHALLKPAELVKEAQQQMGQLLGVLKLPAVTQLPGSVAIVVVKALGVIAGQRPNHAGRILPMLLRLTAASKDGQPQVSDSVKTAVKAVLLGLLKQQAPAVQPWKKKMVEALYALGARDQADSEMRRITQVQREPADLQRALPAVSVEDAKAPAPVVLSQHKDPLMALPPAVPKSLQVEETTPDAELKQVLAILAALLAEDDRATCDAFVNGLSPAVLTDVVIANMALLPSPQDVAGPQPHAAPGPASGNALLAGLMQVLPSPQQQQQQQLASSGPLQSNIAAAQPAPLPVLKPEAPAATARPLPKAVIPPAALKLAPVALSESQQAALMRASFQRVLTATKTPAQQLRASLLAKLVSQVGVPDVVEQDLMHHVVEHVSDGGFELAVQWLHSSFAAEIVHERPSQEAITAQDLGTTAVMPDAEEREGPNGAASAPRRDDDDEAHAAESLPSRGLQDGVGTTSTSGASHLPPQGYTRVLRQLLGTFRAKLLPKDRALARLLLEAPALPEPLVPDLLRSLFLEGGEHATLALIATRDIMAQRPAIRLQALQVILSAAVAQDGDVRSKAVRLIANKLFPEAPLTARIQDFATQQLHTLLAKYAPSARKRKDLDNSEGAQPGYGESAEEQPMHKRLRAASDADTTEAGGASMPGSEANGSTQPAKSAEDSRQVVASRATQVGKDDASEMEIDSKAGAEGEGIARLAAAPQLPSEPNSEETRNAPASLEEALRYCELYCALCTKRHALLRELFTVYGRASKAGRGAILKNADGLARVLGPSAAALIALVHDPPPGSEPLLIKMLYFLTESQPPPQVLVDACLQNYAQHRNSRLLPPALVGLTGQAALGMLPKLLDLEPAAFQAALHRLLMPLPSGGQLCTPTEVLVALHSIDAAKEGVPLKAIIGALDQCVALRSQFTKTALASALQQLVQRTPLPQLFMRFLIQAEAAVPDLKGFMLEQLAVLVNKQIWTNRTLFKGWILAIRQHIPDSFQILLQLPTRVLSDVLRSSPQNFRSSLAEYATSSACPANQGPPILRLLDSTAPDSTEQAT